MSSDNWTYALCKSSTVEKAVFREDIEVALDLVPCIDGVIGFGADKSENTESFMSTGPIPVKLSQFPPPSTSLIPRWGHSQPLPRPTE
jgi:hypothetical protein